LTGEQHLASRIVWPSMSLIRTPGPVKSGRRPCRGGWPGAARPSRTRPRGACGRRRRGPAPPACRTRRGSRPGAERGGQAPGQFRLFPELLRQDVFPQLALPDLAAQGHARRPAPEVEPALEVLAGARRRGGRQHGPVRGPVGGRQDLDDVARLERGLERSGRAVDPGPGRVKPDLRMDLEGEIEGRGPERQVNDLALGREDVDLLGDEVCLEAPQELLRVLLLLEEGGHLPEPVEAPVLFHRPGRAVVLVAPVGGDAVLARSCISRVRIWISNFFRPSVMTVVCRAW